MYLTLQRRSDLRLCLEKRIVGIENVVEEEEYNQFDEVPSFDTAYKPQLFGTNKVTMRPYLHDEICKITHTHRSCSQVVDLAARGQRTSSVSTDGLET
jgi:hypothetical protein